ncbi:MAG TPA: SDR family NAD(P)-dependent oxidoreductase [Gemmatimonadaceae bacterium]|jgi:NAD(P)-dependent dehydrogenase (short-subunit alcohol dehydrogenase family)
MTLASGAYDSIFLFAMKRPPQHSTVLITGATSGLGHAAARALAEEGWTEIIITGRRLAKVQETATELAAETKKLVFTPLELDLDKPSSVQSALAALVKRGRPIDFLLLNAGMVPGKKQVVTATGIEAAEAPLIGHHQLTVGLLRANLLSPEARIVIAGAEPARGDVPLFSLTDVAALAAKHHKGNRSAAVEALLRGGPTVKYAANRAYADAKLIVAWWATALSRRLPSAMAVYAVAPGSAPDTKASRNAPAILKYLFIPLVKLIPGMTQTPETAARRYLQALEFGTDLSGQFFASAPKKLTGPMEAMRQPHLHDRANQEAAWQAVVSVSGADLPHVASFNAVS